MNEPRLGRILSRQKGGIPHSHHSWHTQHVQGDARPARLHSQVSAREHKREHVVQVHRADRDKRGRFELSEFNRRLRSCLILI